MSVFVSAYQIFFCLSLVILVADSERAAGSGDKKTTGLFQSDATTRRVGKRACRDARSASCFLIHGSSGCFPKSLCYKLHPRLKAHTQHEHTPKAFAPAHAHVHSGLH